MYDTQNLKESQKTIRSLIHDLNHQLAITYGNIEISILCLQNKEIMEEHGSIIDFLSEAKATHGEVKTILEEISTNIKARLI